MLYQPSCGDQPILGTGPVVGISLCGISPVVEISLCGEMINHLSTHLWGSAYFGKWPSCGDQPVWESAQLLGLALFWIPPSCGDQPISGELAQLWVQPFARIRPGGGSAYFGTGPVVGISSAYLG